MRDNTLEVCVQRRPETISSLKADRGLYLLRYVGAIGADAPVIHVRPSPGSEDVVTILAAPGELIGRLAAPGSIALIVVEQDAMLQITAQAMVTGGSLQAEVRLDPLHHSLILAQPTAPEVPSVIVPMAGVAPPVNVPTPVTVLPRLVEQASEPVKDFDFFAHVSRSGDVVGEEGIWIGGPDAPAPIEGLSLKCSARFGIIQYQVLIAGGGGRWSDWLSAGSFGGSRGRAMPLTGVRIRFAPANGHEMSLEGEALFLGSPVVRQEGTEVEFVSTAGLDPLVGLRLGIKRALPAVTKPSVVATGAPNAVRFYRASSVRRSDS